MQKTIGLAMIALVCLALGASDARAQDAEVSANAGWVSQYYYRGAPQKNSFGERGSRSGRRAGVGRDLVRRRRRRG